MDLPYQLQIYVAAAINVLGPADLALDTVRGIHYNFCRTISKEGNILTALEKYLRVVSDSCCVHGW